jgi:predicted esterase
MEIAFARQAREVLQAAGLQVSYHKSDAAHHIDPDHIPAATAWLATATPPGAPAPALAPDPQGQ